MAEYTANALQEVATNANVLLTDTPVKGSKCIVHREGSGLVTLRGLTNQCNARFKAWFGANIAIPTDGTAPGQISLALALNGEPVVTTTATATPPVVNRYFNVSSAINIYVPQGCCTQLSIENVSDQAIDVQNANLIIERIA